MKPYLHQKEVGVWYAVIPACSESFRSTYAKFCVFICVTFPKGQVLEKTLISTTVNSPLQPSHPLPRRYHLHITVFIRGERCRPGVGCRPGLENLAHSVQKPE